VSHQHAAVLAMKAKSIENHELDFVEKLHLLLFK